MLRSRVYGNRTECWYCELYMPWLVFRMCRLFILSYYCYLYQCSIYSTLYLLCIYSVYVLIKCCMNPDVSCTCIRHRRLRWIRLRANHSPPRPHTVWGKTDPDSPIGKSCNYTEYYYYYYLAPSTVSRVGLRESSTIPPSPSPRPPGAATRHTHLSQLSTNLHPVSIQGTTLKNRPVQPGDGLRRKDSRQKRPHHTADTMEFEHIHPVIDVQPGVDVLE